MPIYRDYEDLGRDLKPSDAPPVEGEPWKAPPTLPKGFPKKPDPSPECGTTEPSLFGEEIGVDIKRPLILVPGILATALDEFTRRGTRKFAARTVWPPVNLGQGTTSPVINISAGNLRPTTTSSNPLIPGAYDGLITFLQDELHYELDKTLFIFGYNWTQSNETSGQRLAGFIRLVESKFNWGVLPDSDRKVDIICHSMGGLVTRSAIRIWGAQVKRSIYLASPHYGAPKAYWALHPKAVSLTMVEDFLVRATTNLSLNQSMNDTLRSIVVNMPSAYELLPDKMYFTRQQSIVEIDDWGSNTVVSGLLETYKNNNDTALINTQRVDEAMEFKDRLGASLPGEIHYVISSDSYSTGDYVVLTTTNTFPSAVVYGGTLTTGAATPNGDGTVPIVSGRGPGLWDKVTAVHTMVPNIRETFWYIALFLRATG